MNWLDEYEAKLKAATPGPWKVYPDEHEDGVENRIGTVEVNNQLKAPVSVVTLYTCWHEPHHQVSISSPDAEFIAASPEMVAKLIAAVQMAEMVFGVVAERAQSLAIDVAEGDLMQCDICDMAKEMLKGLTYALDKLQSGEFEEGDE